MAVLRLHRTYRFRDKDPVIDEIRTLIRDEGLIKRLNIVSQLSGVATSTVDGWLFGDTISPQNRTLMAVTTSLGYKRTWSKDGRKWDLDKELRKAAAWDRLHNKVAKTNGQSRHPKRKSS